MPDTLTTPAPAPRLLMPHTALPVAALVYTPSDHLDPLMAEIATVLQAQGIRVGGIIQHNTDLSGADPCAMMLEDLSTHTRFSLSQNLGPGSEACRLDSAALAHAATAIRHAIENQAELIIINKFSTQEAAGSGLRSEIGAAAIAGIPLLTAVGTRFLPQWHEFTGEHSTLLTPSLSSALAWWEQLAQSAQPSA